MQLKQFRVLLPVLYGLLSLGLLLWFFRNTLEVSLVRYFDADEFAYLHWAHNVYHGELPYRDFLFFVPPGFLYVLSVLYVFSGGIMPLIAGRIFSFVIFVGIVGVMCWIFWRMRRSWVAWLAGVLLVVLPMPADKFLEIRPDNLAMLLALLGLAFLIEGFTNPKRLVLWGAGGALYSLSLLVLPKTLPQVAVSGAFITAWVFCEKELIGDRLRVLYWFVAGLLVPFGIFGIGSMVLMGNPEHVSTMVYSLTKLPLEVGRIGELFGMQPDLFFYPNSVYYGAGGWNTTLLVNHIIWLIGLLMGCVRLVTPALPHGRQGIFKELLITATWFSYVVIFMYGYPLRHAQYLIPSAVFVAWFAADFIHMLWGYASRSTMGSVVFAICYFVGLLGLTTVAGVVTASRLQMTNREDKAVVMRMLGIIPKDEYVFDLVGTTLYYKDPYYACCVPYGQWSTYQSRLLPSLPEALERTNTRFIYQGRLMRTTTLSQEDQTYIRTHFVSYQHDASLLIRK